MFMKHYAPNRFEPSIEVIVKMGVRPGRGLVGSKEVGGPDGGGSRRWDRAVVN